MTEQEVLASRQQYGENVLTPPKQVSLWKLYIEKYKDPIIQILLVAAIVSLLLAFWGDEYMDTIGILFAVFLATTVGFLFEVDAARKFNILNALGEEQPVKVRREGRVMEIPRREVVVGDIVLVETGDEVPADGKLLLGKDLQVNESSLTGEPVAEKRVDGGQQNGSAYPQDVLLRSSMVMSGRGEMRVTAVGDATEIGQVARTSTEMTQVKTPLNIQLNKLAKMISKAGTAISVAAFAGFLIHDILTSSLWHGTDYFMMAERVLGYFMMAVTLIVMAVPEGLPMAVTLSLALNMRRMLKGNNLVRRLHACETMGAVTVICTDKTGTLTENRMQVETMFRNEQSEKNGNSLDLLPIAIALNSTAELNGGDGIGNPTEVALLRWLENNGYDYEAIRKDYQIDSQVLFSTERKYMSTDITINGVSYHFVKGAPEIVMNMCGENWKETAMLEEWQRKGMRTLAFAVNDKLQALCAISDPIRADVPQAVRQCQAAGIEVKIVTGDTSATAAEIGRQIGILSAVSSDLQLSRSLITGTEWAALTDEEALERCRDIRVMSRARPADKQRLVEMLQKRGEIVAVTGDGTNDAPALHHAHIGLSLGSGTSVAKEASDMTLIDDSFRSIAQAVMWGRSLYKNLQRFLFFQLVVNLAAMLLVFFGSIIGTEMPLTVTQILWVNLIMDTFAAMALSSLPPSREVMSELPRKQTDFIITREMGRYILFWSILFFAGMFIFLIWCERNGSDGIDIRELTWFFTTFVMLQWWNLFNAKTLGSHYSAFRRLIYHRGILVVLALILLGQWLIVQYGGSMFRTVPLSFREWLTIIGITSVVLWIGEIWRLCKRHSLV